MPNIICFDRGHLPPAIGRYRFAEKPVALKQLQRSWNGGEEGGHALTLDLLREKQDRTDAVMVGTNLTTDIFAPYYKTGSSRTLSDDCKGILFLPFIGEVENESEHGFELSMANASLHEFLTLERKFSPEISRWIFLDAGILREDDAVKSIFYTSTYLLGRMIAGRLAERHEFALIPEAKDYFADFYRFTLLRSFSSACFGAAEGKIDDARLSRVMHRLGQNDLFLLRLGKSEISRIDTLFSQYFSGFKIGQFAPDVSDKRVEVVHVDQL